MISELWARQWDWLGNGIAAVGEQRASHVINELWARQWDWLGNGITAVGEKSAGRVISELCARQWDWLGNRITAIGEQGLWTRQRDRLGNGIASIGNDGGRIQMPTCQKGRWLRSANLLLVTGTFGGTKRTQAQQQSQRHKLQTQFIHFDFPPRFSVGMVELRRGARRL
jgi:hypothetical protein